MGAGAEYEIWRRHGVDISDNGWLERNARHRKPQAQRMAKNARKKERQEAAAMLERANKPKEERLMKTKNQLRNLAASVSDEVVTVQCQFTEGGKNYTYLCPVTLADSLEKGQMVLVSTATDEVKSVRVAEVDDFADIDDVSIVYQWVFDTVDETRLEGLRIWHKRAGEFLAKQQRQAARAKLLEGMNVTSVPVLEHTSGLSEDVIDTSAGEPDESHGSE